MTAGADQLVAVTVTFGNAEEAEAVASELVEARLAACAQVWPIRSIYRWQDKVERAQEHRLEAKTTAAALPALEARVRERHSYDVPEIIAVPVVHASADYARWVRESVSAQAAGRQ